MTNILLSTPRHRSRIRRRSCISSNHSGDTDNGNGNRGAMSSAARIPLAVAAAAAALLSPMPVEAYLGPTLCTKQGVTAAAAATSMVKSTTIGYSTFNHLLFDMVSLASSFKSGRIIPDEQLTFRICPGSVIDLDDSSMPLGFLPIEVPRLTLQCGNYGKQGSKETGDACIIRGGGKRDPGSKNWNVNPQKAYKSDQSGIVGGGQGSVAQIYVYGDSAYEVTLRGLTFDNSMTRDEQKLYESYMTNFGGTSNGDESEGREKEKIEEEFDESVPNSPSSTSTTVDNNEWGGADQLKNDRDNVRQRRKQQGQEKNVGPAHRFASVAVRGKGYGDDAGPRLLTIENCRFEYHRGYAVLVSPGIQQPDLPIAPEFDLPNSPSKPTAESQSASELAAAIQSSEGDKGVEDIMDKVTNVQSSGQIYGKENGVVEEGEGDENGQFRKKRRLNLLDNGGKFIDPNGMVSYYDNSAGRNYHDGRRVKIVKSEFSNNVVSGDNVAGLITSAYSLTLTDCFFQKNSAKAMVFVYNNEALVDNTIFAENTVEVSTIIMASPKGSKPLMAAIKSNGELAKAEPTHIVERTCFLGSHVGMSNVLVTDVENTGFGQRDNHATGTEFTWVSNCEGGAAEKLGNDCLETGNCDGTCVRFTSEKCLAERINSREYDMFFNAGYCTGRGIGGWVSSLGMALLLLWVC